jgi:hypothetical protein
MSPRAVFGISVLLAFVVWGMIAVQYVWPALHSCSEPMQGRSAALPTHSLIADFRERALASLEVRNV